ncbi:hypothetical protein EUA63_03615 [TM7 phylum sp. oral taxon 348]|nr:hypothetical protein EUA81_03170 [TM7 phylum sp. oral taxon 356]TWP19736.1 hypothetical protein EUA63_03615 [TM7 phylum sp. oral taxon 348]TWP28493.1 hypothetical protein EUA62_00600 [TM7 phylum sp. oral taxon 348]
MSRIVDQKKQQGSVASFIVTGVLLSTVFIGSIVAVKKQFGTNKSSSNDVTKIAKTEDKKAGDNTSTSKSKESTQKESTSKDTGNNNKETESRKKPDSLDNHQFEQKKSETEKQQNQAGAPQQSNPNQELQNQSQQTQLSGASSEALPTTGPIEDIFMMVIGAVAIFGSGYVYYHYGYGRK